MKRVLWLAGLILLPRLLAQTTTPILFRDVATEIGIDFKHSRCLTEDKYMNETMGSGVALLDYDNDGYLDLYLLTNSAASTRDAGCRFSNRLYRNRGDGTFVDVTDQSGAGGRPGYGMGAASADYDNDGWTDLYLTYFGSNLLYRNNGDGTFADVTVSAGVGDQGWASSAIFFDLDNDGHLDLYVVNYLNYQPPDVEPCTNPEGERAYCTPQQFPGAADVLYRNNGDGTFTDVSREAGVWNPQGKGLGVAIWDLNDDGYLDLYIANDTRMNFLYANTGNGSFADMSLLSGAGFDSDGLPEAGMGTTIGDYDLDGRADLFVTNFESETNTLYRGEGSLRFEDVTFRAGVGESSLRFVGFGTCFFDADADGDLDLFVANGHIDSTVERIPLVAANPAPPPGAISYAQPNLLYENRDGRFWDISESAGINGRGAFVSRGTALGDLDNDGDLDLVVTNSGDRPQVLLNQTPQEQRAVLVLQGRQSNRSAIGARVSWQARGRTYTTFVDRGGSYLSARDGRVFIGFGGAGAARWLEVRWPAGSVQRFEELKPGFLYRLIEGQAVEPVQPYGAGPSLVGSH